MKAKINIFGNLILFILLAYSNFSLAQTCGLPDHIHGTASSNYNCSSSSAYTDFGIANFIPTVDDEVLIIPVNIHVMQKEGANPENFQDIPEHQQFFQDWINLYLSNKAFRHTGNQELCMGTPTNAPLSIDGRIQFELKNVYFHKDNDGWNSGGCVYPDYYIGDNYMTGTESYYNDLNIFLVQQYANTSGSCDADGVGYGGSGDENTKLYVLMNNTYTEWLNSGKNNWVWTGVLSHEIGHCFGLYHINTSQMNIFDNQCFIKQDDYGNNCMGYNGAQDYFSPSQIGHVRLRLLTTWRKRLIKPNTYTFGQAAWEITTNTTIDSDIVWHGDIIVKSGATLTVTKSLYMSKGFKITVEKGARLHVEQNGKITTCGEYWDGVYATGDLSQPQTNTSAQAIVRVRNGGIIENAEFGVNLIDGALGWFDNAVFINNKRAIEFHTYAPNNFSYIKNSQFLINNDYLNGAGLQYVRQVNLSNIRGLDILNNTFTNSRSQKGGTAIESIDAGYHVYSQSTASSTFHGWKYGINAKGARSINTFKVEKTDFTKCDIGLFVEAVDYFDATNNTFELCYSPGSLTPTMEIGIMTDRCTGYDIAFNEFTGYGAGTTLNSNRPIGTLIKDSGNQGDKVEVNTYSGCYIANLSNGDNTEASNSLGGLQYLCNQQSSNLNDIIIPQENGTFGVALFQGSYTEAAGNTFSNIAPNIPEKNILNNDFTSPLDKMHYYFKINAPQQFPAQTVGVDNIAINEEANCKSPVIGGDGPGDGKGEKVAQGMSGAENDYNTYMNATSGNDLKDSELSKLAKLKLDYYQYINYGLFAESMKDERKWNQYEYYLNKKEAEETIIPRIVVAAEQGKFELAYSLSNTLKDENFALTNTWLNNKQNDIPWEKIDVTTRNELKSYASVQDNRSSLVASNILEYYFDDEFDTQIVLPTGISTRALKDSDEKKKFEIVLSPNPTSSLTHISFNQVFSGSISIFNLTGVKQRAYQLKEVMGADLDVNNLKSGIYLVQCRTEHDEVYVTKLIIE